MYMHARIYIHTYTQTVQQSERRSRRCPCAPVSIQSQWSSSSSSSSSANNKQQPQSYIYAPLLKGTRGLSSNINIIDNSIERDELANRDCTASIYHREDYRRWKPLLDFHSFLRRRQGWRSSSSGQFRARAENPRYRYGFPIRFFFMDLRAKCKQEGRRTRFLVTRRQAPGQDIFPTVRRICEGTRDWGSKGGNNKKAISIHKQVTVVRTIT